MVLLDPVPVELDLDAPDPMSASESEAGMAIYLPATVVQLMLRYNVVEMRVVIMLATIRLAMLEVDPGPAVVLPRRGVLNGPLPPGPLNGPLPPGAPGVVGGMPVLFRVVGPTNGPLPPDRAPRRLPRRPLFIHGPLKKGP